MIKLKHILKEDEVEDNFGNVFLGDDEQVAKLQGKDPEKNTKLENEILLGLLNWVAKTGSYNWEHAQKVLWNNYPLLKKAAEVFPQVLKPKSPNGTELYRGLNKLSVSLKKQLFNTNPSDWIEERGLWRYSKPVSYNPHQDIQSWSTSRLVARGFSTEYGSKSAILTTTQNDEYLFNQDLLSTLYSTSVGRKLDESEVLHFGKSYSNEIYIIAHDPLFKEIKDYYFKNR